MISTSVLKIIMIKLSVTMSDTINNQDNKNGLPYYECISTALSHAPLYIHKGDKFFQNKSGKWVSQYNDVTIPSYINITDPNTFKPGVLSTKIKVGDTVRFDRRKDIRSKWSKVVESGRGILKEITPGYVTVEVNASNGRQVHVNYNDISKIDEYYFISSSGHIHKVDLGKNVKADDYRKMTHNFFMTEDEAKSERPDFIDNLVHRPVKQ